MAINQYEDKLKSVYDKHYCSGECINYRQCKKGLVDDGLLFNCAKLGAHYGDRPYRKVLVVGKEPVTQNQKITRTALLDKADNPHYRRTLYTLATILEQEPKSEKIDDIKHYEKLLDYFCLTNYFKCSFTETVKEKDEKKAKKNSGIETSKAMKKECWKILMDEIKALAPEIIIIQGKMWGDEFLEKIKTRFGHMETKYKNGYEELTKHENGPNGGPLYIVWTYHPTARAKYSWNKRLCYLRGALESLRECLNLER